MLSTDWPLVYVQVWSCAGQFLVACHHKANSDGAEIFPSNGGTQSYIKPGRSWSHFISHCNSLSCKQLSDQVQSTDKGLWVSNINQQTLISPTQVGAWGSFTICSLPCCLYPWQQIKGDYALMGFRLEGERFLKPEVVVNKRWRALEELVRACLSRVLLSFMQKGGIFSWML